MRLLRKLMIAAALVAIGLCNSFAQSDDADESDVVLQTIASKSNDGTHSPSTEERLSLLAAALDTHVRRESEPDCSHLVHAIYEAAGLPYGYAPSSDLYAGIENFQRVKAPQAGDLVVWRGHVGIVIKPSQHVFFSYLSSGPGTEDYDAAYWRHRGKPRFYRYIKR